MIVIMFHAVQKHVGYRVCCCNIGVAHILYKHNHTPLAHLPAEQVRDQHSLYTTQHTGPHIV